MITWQKLLFDKDCCSQSFRLLLTRIKSSRRISSRENNDADIEATAGSRRCLSRQDSVDGSVREAGEDGSENVSTFSEPDGRYAESDANYDRKPTRLSGALNHARRIPSKRSAAAVRAKSSEWNFDTSLASPSAGDDDFDSNQVTPVKRDPNSLMGPGIAIERTVPVKPSIGFAAKFKKNQLQVLQHENATLSEENTKLRQEIQHLESLVATLQGDNGSKVGEAIDAFDIRRMRLLQAQNVQLQRQVTLLHDAVNGCEQTEAALSSALRRWRDIVDTAQHDAVAAGADERGAVNKSCNNSEPVKWMFAVPQRLLTELSRVEEQIHSTSTAVSATYEAKLRIGSRASAFIRDNQASVSMSELYGSDRSSLGQLDPNRLKTLEQQLGKVARNLEEFSARVLQRALPPRIVACSTEEHEVAFDTTFDLITSIKDLLLDVGAFGVVVATPMASLSFDSDKFPVIEQGVKMTVPRILKTLGTYSTANVRERDKHVKVMLKQLQACYASIENDAKACRREADYWKTAWKTQAGVARELVELVDRLGRKKLAWIHENVLTPMVAVLQAFDAFQRAHQEGSIRQNPYLPLLIEALTTQQEYVRGSVEQWERYDRSAQGKLDALIAHFEANVETLAAPLAHATR